MRNFYVTTPIYYVNDKPHIGHAYTTILADVLARSHRLLGVPTHFLTGTDEHGQKVQRAAEKNGLTPLQQCDQTVVRFQELWTKLGITHDDFIRTTEPRHKEAVSRILQDLWDRGEIYSSEYEGLYCVPCERFFTDKDLKEGKCPDCGRSAEPLKEKSYFFRMGKYQERLIQHIEEHPEFIQPSFRRNETLGFLRQPLGDLCISRPKSRLAWGIELPFDRDYVCYVWFDALVNYISAVGYPADRQRFDSIWPASYHLIGKDILTTHTVYWPTMLMAMGLPLPRAIFAHGWWMIGESKMSKSLGNVVNPMEMCEKYGVDAFRYFLLAEMAMGNDASFTEDAFVARYNADLANDLGNMASRVLKMLAANCDGRIPAEPACACLDVAIREKTMDAVAAMRQGIAEMRIDRGLAEVHEAVREANRYFEQKAPWKLAKESDLEPLYAVLYNAAECLRIVSGLLWPVMPAKMRELRLALGLTEAEVVPAIADLGKWGGLPVGRSTTTPGSLFPRIEVEKAPAAAPAPKAEKPAKKEAKPVAAPAEMIEISDFTKVSLKTARVLAAETVPDADKLLKLQVEIAGEPRQIVAGIAKFYTPEQMVGRTIIVVANLKPAVLRGVESQGMLLAAKTGKELRLVTVDGDIASGASVG